jgi:hypothetical protein
MTRFGWLFVGGMVLTLAWDATAATSRQDDVVVVGQGTSSDGEAMQVTCRLGLAVVPSNAFVGECVLTLGADRLTVAGLDAEEQDRLNVVLDGQVIVRGTVVKGTGRFQELAAGGQSGFPVHVEMDPLGRGWTIRGHGSDGSTLPVIRGSLSQGAVTINAP